MVRSVRNKVCRSQRVNAGEITGVWFLDRVEIDTHVMNWVNRLLHFRITRAVRDSSSWDREKSKPSSIFPSSWRTACFSSTLPTPFFFVSYDCDTSESQCQTQCPRSLRGRIPYLVRDPEASSSVLHDDGRVAILDDRRTDNFEVLVLEDDLLVILLLPQPKRRGLDGRLVPSNAAAWSCDYRFDAWPLNFSNNKTHLSTRYSSLFSFTPRYRPVVKCLILIGCNQLMKPPAHFVLANSSLHRDRAWLITLPPS